MMPQVVDIPHGDDTVNPVLEERAAIEAARAILERSIEDPAHRVALAEACVRLSLLPGVDPAEAIELLREAARYDPCHPKIFFHLGRLLHLSGDPGTAVLEYRHALRLAPRSHRTYVHLALALYAMGDDERRLGRRILTDLRTGGDARLEQIQTDLDTAVERWTTRQSDAHPTDGPRVDRRTEPADDETQEGLCRYKNLRTLLLVQELTSDSPRSRKRARRMLDRGKELIDGERGLPEYAAACLLFVMGNREACRELSPPPRDSDAAAPPNPAERILADVCSLGRAETPREFAEHASALLRQSALPAELVCLLYYVWHGTTANDDAVGATALLDEIAAAAPAAACFAESYLAILDHHARLAWAADRLDRAEILWREALTRNPHALAVAHNLALTATRTGTREKYEQAWENAIELRYLLAAAAGDIRLDLDDRIRLHRSFARQCHLRYAGTDPTSSDKLDSEQLTKWMSDAEALGTWLRDWELYYLNSRLAFYSPLHLLGLSRDCSDEEAESARDSLRNQFRLCLQGVTWKGAQAFLQLVHEVSEDACRQAKDPLLRRRDRYFDVERSRADSLTKEAIEQGFLAFKMIRTASGGERPELRLPALRIGRFLIGMPWRSLEPACKRFGTVNSDVDLVGVFLSYITALAGDADGQRTSATEAEERLDLLKGCVEARPESVQLRLALCRQLLSAHRNHEAYQEALRALPFTVKLADREEAGRAEEQFVICVDNAAMAEIPPSLLGRGTTDFVALVAEGRRVLADLPKAGGLRLLIAKALIHGPSATTAQNEEARELLEEGLEHVLTESQLQEFQALLRELPAHGRKLQVVAQVRSLLESAAALARTVAENSAGTGTPAQRTQAREMLAQAIGQAQAAVDLAVQADLNVLADRARAELDNLEGILDMLERG